MEIKGTTHFRQALEQMYLSRYPNSVSRDYNYSHIYGQNLVTLKIDGKWIIPVAKDFKELLLIADLDRNSQLEDFNFERYVIPLIPENNYIRSNGVSKRTADPLIKFLLTPNGMPFESVRTVRTPTGLVYYGGSGFILDNQFNPLVIFAIEYDYPEGKAVKLNPICIINPEVFKKEDIVSKYIVKKMIPLLSDYDARLSWDYEDRYKDVKMKMVITHEISKFIERPAKPVGFLDNELWKCAENNIIEMLEV